jgi:epoxide hydrolase-like predicted phosphatase
MKKIKAIIFDWGGVLIDDPIPGMVRYCADQLHISRENVFNIYHEYAYDFQTDRVSEKILWKKIMNKMGIDGNEMDSLWLNAFKQVYKPKRMMFQLLNRLKKNEYITGLLSNTEKKVMEYYCQLNYETIDFAVFSCAEGIVKPDERIYHIILSRMNVAAEESVFIDDRIENIKGAELAGIKTVLFKNPGQVKQELLNLGVNIGSI